MSTPYSAPPAAGQFPKHMTPMSKQGVPYRAEGQQRHRVPVTDSRVQNGVSGGVLAYGLPTPSPESATTAWQTQPFGSALGVPALQSPPEQAVTDDRSPYLGPRRSQQFDQPSPSPSRSPNLHLRTTSQSDTLSQQNAELRREVDELRAERDQTQAACDAMLTELMTTQETVEEREKELHSLRRQVSLQQHSPGGSVLSRNDEKELRDLRLRCSRLQSECRQKDEQIRQAQTQSSMHQNMYGNSPSPAQHRELSDAQQRFMDAESRANHATQQHQAAQSQADTYAKQLHEWSVAYEALKSSYNDLQRSHAQLSQNYATEQTRSREDSEAKAALDDIKRMRDFYQENSDKVSKKNIELTEQMRRAQDALHARTRELEQQKGTLQALQARV